MEKIISLFFISWAVSVTKCDLFTEWVPKTIVDEDVLKSIKSGIRLVPNVFGIAEYFPDFGQEKVSQTVVKNVIEASLSNPEAFVEDEIELLNVNKTLPTWGRLLMENGKLQGLHSFTFSPLESTSTPDHKVEIKTQLHFKNLRVRYERVSASPLGSKLVDYGPITMKFKTNSLEVRVLIVKYYNMIDRLLKSDCACVLSSLEVKELRGVDVRFDRGADIYSTLVSLGMAYLERAVTEKVNYAVVKYAFDTLTETDSWICRDYRLEKIVQGLERNVDSINQPKGAPTGIISSLRDFFKPSSSLT